MSTIFIFCKAKLCGTPKNPVPSGKPKQRLHYLWMIPPLSFILAVFTLSYIAFYALPEPEIPLDKDSQDSPKFFERNALAKLKALSKIGPRLVGSSEKQEKTIKFLRNSVEEIKEKALDKYDIDEDIQTASGYFVRDGMVSVYNDITNYILKFSSPCCNSSSALLLNSHFDTVPESEGTGDDATMVVVMLEILRVLSRTSKTLKHPVIFLFNGAKENSLQGSHAFITQHKWAKDVKAFINLDSMGLGGREILFRLERGHSWLMKHYSKSALHPYASSIMEELYENKFFRFQTDFDIFHEYGRIPGLDIAQMYNGFVHHTKYDRFATIWGYGFLQNTGDNILALVKSIASSEELGNPVRENEDQVIFFDFLGLFLIHYSETAGIAINISCSVISLTSIAISIWAMCKTMDESLLFLITEFSVSLLIQTVSITIASAIPLLLALIIDAADATMFWYSQEWLIFGIYFCPFCFILAFILALYLTWRQKTFPLRFGIQLFLHSNCFLLIILTVILTSFSIRSTFIIVINIIFYTISVIINWAARLQNQPFIWLIPILVSQIIPLIFHNYSSLIFYTTMLPASGWSGVENKPDITIAGFTIVFAILICGFLAPLLSICRKAKTIISIFMIIFLIFAIIMATPLGFPYTKESNSQRLWIFNPKIISCDNVPAKHLSGSSSKVLPPPKDHGGFLIVPMDRFSPTALDDIFSETSLYNLEKREDISDIFQYDLPIYSTKFYSMMVEFNYWIEAPMPHITGLETQLNIVDWKEISSNRFRYIFEVRGPSHVQMLIKPMKECNYFNVTFIEELPNKEYFQNEIYFIQMIQGQLSEYNLLFIEFEIPPNYVEHAFEISLIGHYNSHIERLDKHFIDLLNFLPRWIAVTPVISSCTKYTF